MNRSPFKPASDNNRPQNVGIHGIEVYFPKTAVRQEELEEEAGVGPGKFTIVSDSNYRIPLLDSRLLTKYIHVGPRATEHVICI